MNTFKKNSRKGVLLLVLTMLLTIPNLQVYSAVGSYNTSTLALSANQDYPISSGAKGKGAIPAILGVLAGVGLFVVGSVGFYDGWSSHHSDKTLAINFEENYDSNDFSKFDY